MEVTQTLNRLVDILQYLQAEAQVLKTQPMEYSFPFQCTLKKVKVNSRNYGGFEFSIWDVLLEFESHENCFIKSFTSNGHAFNVSEGSEPLKVRFEQQSIGKEKVLRYDNINHMNYYNIEDTPVYTENTNKTDEKIQAIFEGSCFSRNHSVYYETDLYFTVNENNDRLALQNPMQNWGLYLRRIVSPDETGFADRR